MSRGLFATVLVSFGCVLAVAQLPVRNVPYYSDADRQTGDYERCKLDIHLPTQVTNGFPTLVYFHGGGLTSGNRRDVDNPHLLAPAEGDTDICIACVGYRLGALDPDGLPGIPAGTPGPDDILMDAASSIAWVLENIASYGGDPQRVFIGGHSAGSYLAMMAALDPDRLRAVGHDVREIAGIVSLSGQMTKHFAVKQWLADTTMQYQPVIDRYAPLYWCQRAPDLPPILMLTGERAKEWPCRVAENYLMVDTLQKLSGGQPEKFEMKELSDQGHGMVGASLTNIVEFIRSVTR